MRGVYEEPDRFGLRFAMLGVVATIALAGLVLAVRRSTAWDDAVWRAVLLARGCGTDAAVEQAVGIATAVLGILMVAAVAEHGRIVGLRAAWPWLATWMIGLLASKTLKHVFTRDRPSAIPDLTIGYSFPSAHVMNGLLAMVAIVALARVFRWRPAWRMAATLATVTIALGRIALGRHWASDALGGVLSALVLVGFVTPAVARRPVAAPAGLALAIAATLAFDARLGEGGMRLPSPLLPRAAAVVDVDVGPEMPSPRHGGWREPGLEQPFGSYLWLEGEAAVVVDVPTTAAATSRWLAIAARPQKTPGRCTHVDVTLNGRRIARFVPFVGWREYRLPVPPGIVLPGGNELAILAAHDGGPARVGVTYVRFAASPSE